MKEKLLDFIEFLKPFNFDWDSQEHKITLVDKFLKEKEDTKTLDSGFDPAPWNMYDYPDKTEGWIEYQRYIGKIG